MNVWLAEKNWKVGRWYKTEGGDSVKVITLENIGPRPIVVSDENGEIILLNHRGKYHPAGLDGPKNLTIEKCTNPFKVYACPNCQKVPVVKGSLIYCKYKNCKIKPEVSAADFQNARKMWNRSMVGIRNDQIEKMKSRDKSQ